MKSCYIVGAADFAPARFAPAPGDFVIAADAGILHLERLGAKPDLVLGDFDSLGRVPDYPDTEVSPVRKDDTDSMLAARRAVERGYGRLLFFGCLGGKRLDHTLANIQTIAWCASRGAEAFLVGEGCCLAALPGGRSLTFDARYAGDFSVFCLGEDARGVTERGLSYSLEGAELSARFPLGVSNSFTGESAYLAVEKGLLIACWQDDTSLPLPEMGKI